MVVAQLVLDYIRALIWPVVILVTIFAFRQRLAGLVTRLDSIDAVGASVKFYQDVGAAQRDLEVAREDPGSRVTLPTPAVEHPKVAAIANRVLASYPEVPHAIPTLRIAEVVADAWGDLQEFVDRIIQEFSTIDPRLAASRPSHALRQLAGLTGVAGWREASLAIERLQESVGTTHTKSSQAPISLGALVAFTAVDKWRERRAGVELIQTVDLALSTLRGLLEDTVTANAPTT